MVTLCLFSLVLVGLVLLLCLCLQQLSCTTSLLTTCCYIWHSMDGSRFCLYKHRRQQEYIMCFTFTPLAAMVSRTTKPCALFTRTFLRSVAMVHSVLMCFVETKKVDTTSRKVLTTTKAVVKRWYGTTGPSNSQKIARMLGVYVWEHFASRSVPSE